MNQTKVMSLKAKLEVDLNSIKRIEAELKKLSGSFKKFEADVRANTAGLDKTIQQAFFGKRGTDRSTIKTFFKNEFKAITAVFVNEIKAASNNIVATATATSNATTNTLANIIAAQQKKITELTKKAKKTAVGSVNETSKPTKYKLSDDDKAFRDYYMASKKEQDKYIALEKRDREKRLKELKTTYKQRELIAAQMMYGDILAEQKAMKQINTTKALETKIKSSNQYGDILAEQKAMKQLQTDKQKYWMNIVQQETNAAKISRNLDEQEYKRKVAAEKAITKQHGEELLAQLKQEQQLYAEKKRLQQAQLDESKAYLKNLYENSPFKQYLDDIKESPLKSFTTGIADGVRGLMGALTSVYEKFKMLFKVIATGGAVAIGSFIGLGAVVQKLASGVLFATEKMRGYQIALFGMMKTQDGVNQLMEKAFKVTKNLPISYEQVYQSTKAFTLIGPVRDMLKNTIEAESVLKRMYSITMALSQIEPEWGLAGAQFSLREALSGDLRSLQRRFEIPVNLIYSKDGRSLRQLKNDPEAMSQALSDYFKEFYNEETLGMAANQFGAILGKIEGIWFNFQSEIGNAGFYDMFVGKLKKVRDELEKFTGTLEFKEVTNKISNALGSSLDSILNTMEKLTVSFGRLIGINVESSNAFQIAADVVEKFAMVLRVVERIVSETDVFGVLNSGLQKTIQLVVEIANYGFKVFNTVARDVDIVIKGIEKLPDLRSMFTENTGRGLFYLWLFGPNNIMTTITGFSTAAIAAFTSIGVVITAIGHANTVAAAKIGVSFLKWGGAIAGAIAGIEQIYSTTKFAMDSIDDDLESSIFYQFWAKINGIKLTPELEFDLNENSKKVMDFLSKSGDTLKKTLRQGDPLNLNAEQNDKIYKFVQGFVNSNAPAGNLLNSVTKDPMMFRNLITGLEKQQKTLQATLDVGQFASEKEQDSLKAEIDVLGKAISGLNDVLTNRKEYATIADRYKEQADLNQKYEGIHTGYVSKMLTAMSDFTSSAYDVGVGVKNVVSEFLKPAISDSEKALLAARRGDITKRGDSAITNLNDGAKIAGAQLLNVFKAAGLGVGVTSGFRSESDTFHNVGGKSYAIDYQPTINGRLITTAEDVKTPEFEGLIAALKANENIANIILEYKNKSIFGDKYKDMNFIADETKKGVVLHVQFKKDLEKSEAGIQSLFTNTIGSFDVLNNIQKIFAEESGKLSPQLENKDFLKQDFQRATEFIHNIYNPTMDAVKEGYKSSSELLATSSKDFEEMFKADEGVAKFGPGRVRALQGKIKSIESQYKQAEKVGVTNTTLFDEILGLQLSNTSKQINEEMINQLQKSLNVSSMGNQFANIDYSKLTEVITTKSKSIKEYIEFINNAPEMMNLIRDQIVKEENVIAEAWGTAIEGKSYDFINIVGSNIKEFQSDLMAKMAEEAAAQAAYENLGSVSGETLSSFYQTMGTVVSIMKASNVTLDEAIVLANIEDKTIAGLINTTKAHYEVIYDNNMAYKLQRMEIEKNINALKRVGSIMELNARKAEFMGDKETRSEFYATNKRFLSEGQYISGGNAFSSGLEEGVNNFLTSFQNINNGAVELVDSMRSNFENGFFDVMNGRLEGLREVFRSVAGGIFQSVTRIIAQIAAINATKLILGIDLNTSGGFAQSGGGIVGSIGNKLFSGAVDSLFSNNSGNVFQSLVPMMSNNSTTSLYNPIGAASQAMAAATGVGGVGNFVSNAMTGAAGAKVAGAKSGIFGNLSKWIQGNPVPALGIAAGLTFLSQPGRLFGGSKDKTGAAQAAYNDYTTKRTAMVGRRGTDAINYYMSGNTSGLSNYQFGNIGYSTWSSGDSWFKGPKEKHAATDSTAYLKSMEEYYSLMMNAGKQHYKKMFDINKMAETNSLASLKEQQTYDRAKLNLIQQEYDRYAATTYTEADKWDKMDEYRNNLLDQEYANMQLQNEVEKVAKETKYAEMQYLTFMKSNGEDEIAMAKTNIEIQKLKIAELTENTLEWYNAKMELMTSEKDLSNSLKEQAKATKDRISAGIKQIYQLGQNSTYITSTPSTPIKGPNGRISYPYVRTSSKIGHDATADEYSTMLRHIDSLDAKQYSEDDIKKAILSGSRLTDKYTWKEIGKTRYLDMGFLSTFGQVPADYSKNPDQYRYTSETVAAQNPVTKKIDKYTTMTTSDGRVYKGGDTITFDKDIIDTYYKKEYLTEELYSIGDLVNVTLDEAMAYVKEQLEIDAEAFLTKYSLKIETKNIYESIGNLLNVVDSSLSDRYENLKAIQINYNDDTLMTESDREIAKAELGVEIANFYSDMATDINQWIQSGLVVDFSAVNSFSDAIQNGLNDSAMVIYNHIKDVADRMTIKGNVLSSIKDMEDFSIVDSVLNTDEMTGMRDILGINVRGMKRVQKEDYFQMVPDDFTMNLGGQYDDPYEAWFEFNKSQINSRIEQTKNKEGMEDEYYQAEYDLFGLMIENAERLKQKAEEVNRSIEDMLGKIEETMRMRIAEERETSKGDVYFIDAGATRNSQKMLDDMLAKVQTNDPAARQLIEEFRKKMMGIK